MHIHIAQRKRAVINRRLRVSGWFVCVHASCRLYGEIEIKRHFYSVKSMVVLYFMY